jgi:hypothetical protein
MRRLALALAAVLMAVAMAWLTPPVAYACSCTTDSEAELIRRAEVIFTGVLSNDRSQGNTRTYTFTVDRVYRGQVSTSQTVNTDTQTAACGLDLQGTGPFLVLGNLQNGVLWANSCGGTRTGPVPAELGAGSPPQPGSAPTGITWTPGSGTATLLVGAAFVGIALVLARRSGRPS